METITESRKRRRKRLIAVEASEDYVRWLDGLTEHTGQDRSTTIDLALRKLAESARYRPKPPQR